MDVLASKISLGKFTAYADKSGKENPMTMLIE